MNYKISVTANGYLLTVTQNVAGKGEVVQQRFVFTSKDDLIRELQKNVITPEQLERLQDKS